MRHPGCLQALLAVAFFPACGGPCPSGPVAPAGGASAPVAAPPAALVAAPAPASAAGAPAAALSRAQREKIAVLPLRESQLFRAERAALRQVLMSEVARKLPAYDVVPVPEADAALVLRPGGGASCGDDEESMARRAFRKGWLATSLVHVLGVSGRPGELWVEIKSSSQTTHTLQATWNSQLGLFDRYRGAFAAMVVHTDEGGGIDLVGGLSSGSANAAPVGALRLCERRQLSSCAPESKAFGDQAAAFTQCFAGTDEAELELLFESSASCEVAELDDLSGADGRREQCLCRALQSSAAAGGKPGRRSLSIHFEAPDLAGKPRPEVRAVEASTNLHAESDWHDVPRTKDNKTVSRPVLRLGLDGLDAARVPLARCGLTAGTLLVADLGLSATGGVDSVRVVSGAPSKKASACVETALKRSRWGCTEDGKAASVRVSASWE